MDEYAALARKTVETLVTTGRVMDTPPDLPEGFYRTRKGVFVTIFKAAVGQTELRGCMGTIAPTRQNVAEEIIQNAVWASQEDDRFSPVTVAELADLRYEVSILEPAEVISSLADLDPRRYGLIVKGADQRCGLLLPDLAGVDSALNQVEIAARKGRIDLKRDKFTLWRFTVTKYEEDGNER